MIPLVRFSLVLVLPILAINDFLSSDQHDAELFLRHLFPFNRYLHPEAFAPRGNIKPSPPTKPSLFSPDEVAAGAAKLLSPVVFVPGLTMSKIAANLHRPNHAHFYCTKSYQNYTLWISTESFRPFENYCWSDDNMIRWEVSDKDEDGLTTVREKDVGVGAYLPGFTDYTLNSTDSSNGYVMDGYGLLQGNMTEKLGYTRSQWGNWYFDFRRGPNEYAVDGTFAKLKKQIEIYYQQANGATGAGAPGDEEDAQPKLRVVLVSVSMGGPVIHAFFNWIEQTLGQVPGAAWKDKSKKAPLLGSREAEVTMTMSGRHSYSTLWGVGRYVERWISASGVFAGTSMVTSTTIKATKEDMYGLEERLWWVDWEGVRAMMTSWAGVHFMQPQFLDKNETLVQVVAKDNHDGTAGTTTNYTFDDLETVLRAAPLAPEIAPMFGAQKRWFFEALDAPGVDVDCVHGSGQPVARSWRFVGGLDQAPEILKNDTGDAVANDASLRMCREWAAMPSHRGKQIVDKDFKGLRHAAELGSKEGVEYLIQVLREVALANLRKRDGGGKSLRGEEVLEAGGSRSSVAGPEEVDVVVV